MKIPAVKGCYALIIKLNTPTIIPIGKRRNYSFRAGYYAYVGSALNGLERRIGRYLQPDKKFHWHIDYLLACAEVRGVVYAESSENQECRISREFLSILPTVPDFGCSDCRCLTHLFYHNDPDVLRQVVFTGFRTANLVPVEVIH